MYASPIVPRLRLRMVRNSVVRQGCKRRVALFRKESYGAISSFEVNAGITRVFLSQYSGIAQINFCF